MSDNLVESELDVETLADLVRKTGKKGYKVAIRASSNNDPVYANVNGSQTIGIGKPQEDAEGNLDLDAQALYFGVCTTGSTPLKRSLVEQINSASQTDGGFPLQPNGMPYVIRIRIWSTDDDGEARYEFVPRR